MSVSREILRQLGGARFIVMTGASKFVGTGNSLTMKLPTEPSPKGVGSVEIILTPMDDYTMITRDRNYRTINTVHGVYCDNLEDVFETETGLYTHL